MTQKSRAQRYQDLRESMDNEENVNVQSNELNRYAQKMQQISPSSTQGFNFSNEPVQSASRMRNPEVSDYTMNNTASYNQQGVFNQFQMEQSSSSPLDDLMRQNDVMGNNVNDMPSMNQQSQQPAFQQRVEPQMGQDISDLFRQTEQMYQQSTVQANQQVPFGMQNESVYKQNTAPVSQPQFQEIGNQNFQQPNNSYQQGMNSVNNPQMQNIAQQQVYQNNIEPMSQMQNPANDVPSFGNNMYGNNVNSNMQDMSQLGSNNMNQQQVNTNNMYSNQMYTQPPVEEKPQFFQNQFNAELDFEVGGHDEPVEDPTDFLAETINEAKQYNIEHGHRSEINTTSAIFSELTQSKQEVPQPDMSQYAIPSQQNEQVLAGYANTIEELLQPNMSGSINEPIEFTNAYVQEPVVPAPAVEETSSQDSFIIGNDASANLQDDMRGYENLEAQQDYVKPYDYSDVEPTIVNHGYDAALHPANQDGEGTVIVELTQKLEKERIFREEIVLENRQILMQMKEFEQRQDMSDVRTSKLDKTMNSVLIILIVALFLVMGLAIYFLFIERGVLPDNSAYMGNMDSVLGVMIDSWTL